MRLVEEGFGESIPAAVIPVYSVGLTVRGEVSLRGATHLQQLPKTLTSAISRQVRGILAGRGLGNFGPFVSRGRTHAIPSRIFSPQKFSRISMRGALADRVQSRTAQTDEQVSTIVGSRGGERRRKTCEARKRSVESASLGLARTPGRAPRNNRRQTGYKPPAALIRPRPLASRVHATQSPVERGPAQPTQAWHWIA
jgi:hypothetical protein